MFLKLFKTANSTIFQGPGNPYFKGDIMIQDNISAGKRAGKVILGPG